MKHPFYLRLLIPLLAVLALTCSCVDPVTFDSEGGEIFFVVEGLVTDNPDDAIVVRYSYSNAFGTGASRPIPFATVVVFDDLGNVQTLEPQGSGIYQSKVGDNRLVRAPGRSYTLQIRTTEGKTYQSTPAKMLPVAPIEDFRFEETEKKVLNTLGNEVIEYGYNIVAIFNDPAETEDFYRWQYEGTFEIVTKLPPPPENPNIDTLGTDPTNPTNPTPDCCTRCWRTDFESDYSELSIFSDEFLNGERIEREVFFLERDRRFLIRYAWTLRQLSLTESDYNFWRSLQEQQENNGSLFAPEVGNTQGNIYNVDDPTEVVLGHFGASSVATYDFVFDRTNIQRYTISDTLVTDCRNLLRSTATKPDGF